MFLLDLLFPQRCIGCGRIGEYICNYCRKTIRIIGQNEAICPVCEKPAIDGLTHPRCRGLYAADGLTSFFRYDRVVRMAVKSVKYRLISDLADAFVRCVPPTSYNLIPPEYHSEDTVLIPVPLHKIRQRARGFNQAEILGLRICRILGIRMRNDILIRTRQTIPQVDMKSREERLKNMSGVFSVRSISGMIHDTVTLDTVLLFDDVFTTGATMRAAANCLKRAGVKQVWAVTMAR